MNMKVSKFQLVVFLAILVSIFGCEKDKDILKKCNCKSSNAKTCIVYEQTYCADPWGQDSEDDEILINNLKEHFDHLDVVLYDIGIDEKGIGQGCDACHCKSGKIFCAKVKNENLNKVKEQGFKEQWKSVLVTAWLESSYDCTLEF